LNTLSPPENGDIVYVSEGANTMDISRSIIELQHPRQRLDAGTYATMGVGLGYMIAAHAAYNLPSFPASKPPKPKKIVALEGDSAFGFSGMEVETLARHRIPALIFVVNNSGIYHGDTTTEDQWRRLQEQTVSNQTSTDDMKKMKGLRSTSLTYETRYEYMANMCGGKGHFVRTEEELERATKEGFLENNTLTIVNVIVEPGLGKSISFGWQAAKKKGTSEEAKL
jgi:2-hydroxyacyl-CoA lyase 1